MIQKRFTHYGRVRMFNELQRNRAIQPPTEEEQKQTYYAIDMLLFVQCLMTCTYDLRKALRDAGMLRHKVKQVMNRMDEVVAEVCGVAYRVFSERANLGWQYIERAEAAYKVIDESVFGVGEPGKVSKYLSIALALIELIGEYNDMLSFRFRFDEADKLRCLPVRLSAINAPINTMAKTIIKNNVTAKNLNIKINE